MGGVGDIYYISLLRHNNCFFLKKSDDYFDLYTRNLRKNIGLVGFISCNIM